MTEQDVVIHTDINGRTVTRHPDDTYSVSFWNTSIHLPFQSGCVGSNGVNGLYSEQLILLLIDRYNQLNAELPHGANLEAIAHLNKVLEVQSNRYAERLEAGTFGTNNP